MEYFDMINLNDDIINIIKDKNDYIKFINDMLKLFTYAQVKNILDCYFIDDFLKCENKVTDSQAYIFDHYNNVPILNIYNNNYLTKYIIDNYETIRFKYLFKSNNIYDNEV